MELFESVKERVLSSPDLDGSGRRAAERLMNPDGLIIERLFDYLGDLEDRLSKLESQSDA